VNELYKNVLLLFINNIYLFIITEIMGHLFHKIKESITSITLFMFINRERIYMHKKIKIKRLNKHNILNKKVLF
jgi:hypothetical protein